MRFPNTNKIKQDINDDFGENSKELEELMKQVDWHFFLKFYAVTFSILVFSIFVLIVVVKAALTLF